MFVLFGVLAAFCQAKSMRPRWLQVNDTPQVAAAKKQHAIQWLKAKVATDSVNLMTRQFDHERSVLIPSLLMAAYVSGSDPAVTPYLQNAGLVSTRKRAINNRNLISALQSLARGEELSNSDKLIICLLKEVLESSESGLSSLVPDTILLSSVTDYLDNLCSFGGDNSTVEPTVSPLPNATVTNPPDSIVIDISVPNLAEELSTNSSSPSPPENPSTDSSTPESPVSVVTDAPNSENITVTDVFPSELCSSDEKCLPPTPNPSDYQSTDAPVPSQPDYSTTDSSAPESPDYQSTDAPVPTQPDNQLTDVTNPPVSIVIDPSLPNQPDSIVIEISVPTPSENPSTGSTEPNPPNFVTTDSPVPNPTDKPCSCPDTNSTVRPVNGNENMKKIQVQFLAEDLELLLAEMFTKFNGKLKQN